MSGVNEIIDWVQQEIILKKDSTPEREFADISKIFERDSRLPLADILGDESPQFFEYLENNIPRSERVSTPDETIRSARSLLREAQRFISRLFR